MDVSEDLTMVQHGVCLSDLHGGPGGTMSPSIQGRDMSGDMSLVDPTGGGDGVQNEVDEYFGCQIDKFYILMSNLIQN